MKKNKYISTIIIIIVLLVSSIGLWSLYPSILSNAKAKNYDDLMINYFMNNTRFYDYIIDKNISNHENEYSQYFHISGGQITPYLQQQQDKKINDFYQKEEQLKKEKNILYFATDTKTNKTLSNTNNDIKNINKNKNLQKKYKHYYQISFNNEGIMSIHFNSQNMNTLINSYLDFNLVDTYVDDNTELTLTTPKNLTITYAIPHEIVMNDQLSNYLDNYNHYLIPFQIYITPFAILGIIITILTILLIPFRYLKENQFLHFISKIKFGILSIFWVSSLCMIIEVLITIIHATISEDIIYFYETFAIGYMEPYLTPILNIGIWFIFFTWFAILAYMIKYLINKGLKAYFKENTLLYWSYQKSKKYILKLLNFDFQDNANQIILKIVIFNFIILIFISQFFVAGELFAFIIYSLIIFFILKKKYNEIQNDYQVLLKATQQLSNGQFDYEINEDIGMFNPLKYEFSHIKEGFEKAVNEEVKSQRTKTELISNVSHDLKTPLTSIITYVDLLKNNHIEEKQRIEYLKILERNSLRLKNLIDDLFEVSKASSGDIRLDIIDVDIISMIKQVELEYQEQFMAQGLAVRYQYEQDKMICPLDSSKTYRIFENLFVNISKYALENTRVYIQIESDEQYINITFRNISKDEMTFNENEIVERFVQGDRSRNTSGSGLGLAIVKSFIELQGGRFFVQLDGDLFKTIIQFKK